MVAVIHGTKAETVIAVLEMICSLKRKEVEEITLDLSSSMMLIARTVFPKARITNDRFHVQKLYYDALDDLRITLVTWKTKKSNDAGNKAYRISLSDMQTVIHVSNC